MSLYEDIKALWNDDTAALSARWIAELTAAVQRVATASALFNEWAPLRMYVRTSASRGGAGVVTFSVRFVGQEVGTLRVGSNVTLCVLERHEKANMKYFKVRTPAGKWPWKEQTAIEFRKVFADAAENPKMQGRSLERAIEARMLSNMEERSRKAKFAGMLAGIRHAGLGEHEYPFQFPVPISANTGKPVRSRGNIDILARRRGEDNKVRLSVWEVKRPGELDNAVKQAYIYAVTLALILRSSAGEDLYRLLGFTRKLPGLIELEAVVAVTEDRREKVNIGVAELLRESPLKLEAERAVIRFHAAYYHPETLAIQFERVV